MMQTGVNIFPKEITPERDKHTGFYFFVRRILILLFRIFSRTTILGLGNVPARGPFLFTPNHLSQIDTPLFCAVVPRQLRVFAAEKYKRNPFLHFLFEKMGCVWVRQFEADHEALRDALHLLRGGGTLGIAPEGTRSRETHALQRGRGGAALLATRSGAPILPAAVWGTDTFVQQFLHLKRGSITVRIGNPYHLETSARAKSAELDAATDDMMCAIAALLPPQYRGVYADHPRLAVWLERAGE
jgi:1-acyl-sn-glycerol-3-phosphate acyltransferase